MAALAVDVSQAVQLKCFKSQLPSLDYHITQHAKGANIIQHTEGDSDREREKEGQQRGKRRNEKRRATSSVQTEIKVADISK